MPDDFSSQQHERLASAPSWGKAEDIRPPSALESALWKFPSLALHAHAGLVNLTGSVAGGVVSGFRDVISPAALASAATITGTVGQVMGTAPMPKGGWGGGSEIQTDEGVEDLSDLYGQDEDNFLQDTDLEDSYAPAHRYDDSAELVVWADGGVYPPPTEPESEAREDSPAMNQLQRDVARMLGWTTSSSPRAREPALQDQAGRGAEGGPGESQAVGSDVQGSKGRQAVERDRETIAQVRRIAAGLLGRFLRVGFLTYRLVVAGAVGILRSPYQRCLRLLHVLGAAFEGMLVSVVLLGTTASNSMRRILRAPVRGLPSPNVCQRLATSFTRFLHAHCPGLLAHPIFYGGPFPWQWKLGRSILRRSSSSPDGAAGLPPLAVLLRDLGGAVVSSQGQAGRRRPRDKRQERSQPHLHRHTPLWSLPQHVKDDWSKSTLQIDASSREWADMPVPPPPSPRLDLISPVEENKLPLAVVQEKGDRSLRKEVRTALKRHEEERAATPSGPPRPTGGSSPSSPTAAKATGSGRNEATATATDPARQEETSSYKGPELFTSYFPLELEDFIAEDVARMGSTAGYGVAASTAAQVGGTSAKEESSRSVSGEEAHVSLGAEKHARTGPSEKTSVSTANQHVSVDLPPNPPFPASTSDGKFDKNKLKELAQKESEADAVRAAGDSAYGRILADLNTQPMPVTEEVEDAPPGLNFALPYAASIPSLERMDQRMVALAVESALTVQSKSQLWRYIEEIGISPLLAAIKKDFENDGGGSVEEADMDDSSHGDSNIASPYSLFPSSVSPVAPSPAFPALDDRQAGDTHVLRVEAVEAILHLMEVARDLRVLRAAFEEGPGLAPVVGVEVVADLIDLIEEPLLLLMPRIIRPRNDELLYRGQRAAVEVLFQLVLASDKAISLAQKDGRLWNALQQMTADGMYAAGSPTFATCHKLLAALGHNEWRPRQPGQRGLRILSFDGGGTRGVLSVALLKQVMKRVGKDVFETFDVICGTSTGGILAVLFGIERRTVDEAEALYDKLVSKIFASSPLIQTTKLLLRTSYYDEVVWEQVLQDMLGDNLMIDSMGEGPLSPKVFCASLSLKTNPASLYIWR